MKKIYAEPKIEELQIELGDVVTMSLPVDPTCPTDGCPVDDPCPMDGCLVDAPCPMNG